MEIELSLQEARLVTFSQYQIGSLKYGSRYYLATYSDYDQEEERNVSVSKHYEQNIANIPTKIKITLDE